MNSNLASKVEATFKYYDKDGKRLSIFYIPERKEVVIFRCSKKDVFKKSISWKALAEYLHGSESEYKPVVNKVNFCDKYIQDFKNYCENLFHIKAHYFTIKPAIILASDYNDILWG